MNRERRHLTMLALAIVALLVIAPQSHAASRSVPMSTLESYASQIAGSPTTIACDSDDARGGYVRFDGVIHLQPWICTALANPTTSQQDVAFAMLALQHEATHILLNSSDEGLVECTAFLNRWQLVRLFKLPAWQARWLMAGEVLAHRDGWRPPAYRSVC